MNINSAFPSNFLKASDLQGRHVGVTIREVGMEDIGGEDKPVVYFENKDKGLVLNKTNANMICEIAGSSETDDWIGKRISLYPTRVDFQGRRVDAIRVDVAPQVPTVPNGNQPAATRAVPRREVNPLEFEPDPDDENVPF